MFGDFSDYPVQLYSDEAAASPITFYPSAPKATHHRVHQFALQQVELRPPHSQPQMRVPRINRAIRPPLHSQGFVEYQKANAAWIASLEQEAHAKARNEENEKKRAKIELSNERLKISRYKEEIEKREQSVKAEVLPLLERLQQEKEGKVQEAREKEKSQKTSSQRNSFEERIRSIENQIRVKKGKGRSVANLEKSLVKESVKLHMSLQYEKKTVRRTVKDFAEKHQSEMNKMQKILDRAQQAKMEGQKEVARMEAELKAKVEGEEQEKAKCKQQAEEASQKEKIESEQWKKQLHLFTYPLEGYSQGQLQHIEAEQEESFDPNQSALMESIVSSIAGDE